MNNEIFIRFLANINDFSNKLKKLPAGLLEGSEFDEFLSRKAVRIVLVGAVGVGKSSLLERLIGMEELRLEKGKDCCTRHSLTVRMSAGSLRINENRSRKDTALGNTTALGNNTSGLHSTTTTIDLFSSNPSDSILLEFTDLPGLTSLSRPDQPADYPLYTQTLFDSNVAVADLILLCLPADADVTNSDALRRLRELEIIEEERIIGVISKIDLLENPAGLNNEDFIDVMRSFGSIVAVRNAPNLEMTNSISKTNSREVEFFSTLPDFGNFAFFGIETLRKEIVRLLQEKFAKVCNRIAMRLMRERSRLQERIKALSDPNLITNLLTEHFESIESKITSERIGNLYWKLLPEALESIDPCEGIRKEELKILMKNSQGLKSSLQIEDAFKLLVKSQLRLSEAVLGDFLTAVMRELRECLLVEQEDKVIEVGEGSIGEDSEEFYDVTSGSISEDEQTSEISADSVDLNDADLIKLVPGLGKHINKTVNEILDCAYQTTCRYLDDYCSMHRDLIYCNDPSYLESFREYYRLRPAGSLEEVAMRPIESESIEELSEPVKPFDKEDDESTGFLKEFMALLFPPVPNIKRVEYRPTASLRNRSRIPLAPTAPTAPTTQSTRYDKDESFLLKLLEIYLKSHHRQLSAFLPKCVNYHLIGRVRRELLPKLLKFAVESDGGNTIEVRRMERVIGFIDEIINE